MPTRSAPIAAWAIRSMPAMREMRIGLRVLLGYFLIVALAAWLLAQVFVQQIKPGVRQAQEDTLIDTANVLAQLAAADMRAGRIADGTFARDLQALRGRALDAQLYGVDKRRTSYRVTITDARGIVRFDSDGRDVGRDNSRWNDVYLTLRGQYGARSTREDPADEDTSVMHVAAPIRDEAGAIIGVLTVAKPNRTVAPFIQRSQQAVLRGGFLLMAVAIAMGVWMAAWLSRRLGQLRRYADAVTAGERALPPRLSGEFGALGNALHTMREELEGKQYVEDYVHALTHELKSPLAAIRGASELLHEQSGAMSAGERAQFVATIHDQSARMTQMVDKLLALASVEHRQRIEQSERIDAAQLCEDALVSVRAHADARGVRLSVQAQAGIAVAGDRFLLRQALVNLLDNALAFAPPGSTVELVAGMAGAGAQLAVLDRGPGVPDYARDRLFERFYSLPRPGGGSRSSGLGLPFVQQVAQLHGGGIALESRDGGGTRALLTLPVA